MLPPLFSKPVKLHVHCTCIIETSDTPEDMLILHVDTEIEFQSCHPSLVVLKTRMELSLCMYVLVTKGGCAIHFSYSFVNIDHDLDCVY